MCRLGRRSGRQCRQLTRRRPSYDPSVPSGRAVTRFLGWLVILFGAISQIVSRLLDHRSGDVDAVARVLNASGLSVIAVGTFLVTLGGWVYGGSEPSRLRRVLQVAAPVVIPVT